MATSMTPTPAAAETAAALTAWLRRKPTAKVIAPASAATPTQDPRETIVTIAVRAALYALQSMQSAAADKRALAKWNTPLILAAGDVLDTGTRAWFDRTFIQVQNSGEIPATAQVGDQYLHLEPGQQHTVDGAWAAFIVRIRNTSDDPRSQFTITIT